MRRGRRTTFGRSVRVSAVLRGVEGGARGQCRGSDAEFRLELRSSGAVPSAPMSKVPVGRRPGGHVAQRDRLEVECSRPGETCWPGRANGSANGNPAKPARRGEPGAAGATLAQAAKPGKRVSVLIIRRSWVRAPPAPPCLSCGNVFRAASGFLAGRPAGEHRGNTRPHDVLPAAETSASTARAPSRCASFMMCVSPRSARHGLPGYPA